MRRAKRSGPNRRPPADVRDADGSASLEFITVGLLLLVPLIYLTLAIAGIQGGALAVEGAARQAARVFVQAPDDPTARARAVAAIAVTLADYGLSADDARITTRCRPDPVRCLRRGGTVTITVRAVIALPLVPDGLSREAAVPVESVAIQRVSRYRGAS